MPDTILRKKRPFVGRKDLIAAFRDAVKTKKPDEHKILVYHGVAGIGKTALRIELAKELEKIDSDTKWALLDFEVASYRDIETALFWLRQEFKGKYKIDFPAFDIGYAVYWKKIKPQIPLNQSSFPLWDETGLLADLIKDSGDIPVIGLIPKLIKVVDKADKYISDWFTKRGNTLLRDLPLMEAKDIEKLMPIFLAEDFNNYAEEFGYKTVVFIDTYEQLWGTDRTEGTRFTRDEWIRNIIEKTPGIIWVIGGREELQWAKLDEHWEKRIEPHCVDDLEDKYANKYLKESGIDNEDIRNVIIEGSKGVPFYLDLSVDTYDEIKGKGKKPATGDFGKTPRKVLDRFIRSLNENEIQTLTVLSAARFWDEDIFIALVKRFSTGYPLTKIKEFHRFSFIMKSQRVGIYSMHELIKDALHAHIGKSILAESNRYLFDYYNNRFKDMEITKITPVHNVAFNEAFFHGSFFMEAAKLFEWLIAITDVFYAGYKLQILILVYIEAIKIFAQKLGANSSNLATLINNLALFYFGSGKFNEGEALLIWAHRIMEKIGDIHNPLTTNILNNLGELYREKGDHREAEKYLKKSISIIGSVLGEDHLSVAHPVNNLATLYADMDRIDEAEKLYEKCINILRKGGESQDTYVATVMSNLGVIYINKKNEEKAIALIKTALSIKRRLYGADHPSTAYTLNNLAQAYFSHGNHNQAKLEYKRALEIKEEALGPDHPSVSTTLNDLALLYKSQRKYAEAEALYKRSLEIAEKAHGPDHPSVATTLDNLANLYQSQGKYAEAEPRHKRALKIAEKSLGPDHADVATTLNNLAGIYESQGKYAEAEPLYKRAFEILNKSFGPIHPSIATVLENIARFYDEIGKKEEAEKHLARAEEIRSKLQE